MSNDRDQAIVQSAVSDTGSGLLEFLPALGQREAIAFGDGVALPVRIKFDELPKNCLPRSRPGPLLGVLAGLDRRRELPRAGRRALALGRHSASGDAAARTSTMFAEAMGIPADAEARVAMPSLPAARRARTEPDRWPHRAGRASRRRAAMPREPSHAPSARTAVRSCGGRQHASAARAKAAAAIRAGRRPHRGARRHSIARLRPRDRPRPHASRRLAANPGSGLLPDVPQSCAIGCTQRR